MTKCRERTVYTQYSGVIRPGEIYWNSSNTRMPKGSWGILFSCECSTIGVDSDEIRMNSEVAGVGGAGIRLRYNG